MAVLSRLARLAPLAVLAAGVLGPAASAAAGAPAPAVAQAMSAAFPGARVESRVFALSPAEVKAVEERARVRGVPRLVTAHLAWRNDSLLGAGYLDSRTVRTRAATFFSAVARDTTLLAVDVLAFFEPSEYRPPARWLRRLIGRPLDDRLWPGREIHAITGATLTARSVTESARLALAWHALVTGPALRARGEAR